MSESYEYGDYNRGGMIAFAFSMIVTLLFFVYVAFIHSGVDLKEIPSAEQPEIEASVEVESAEVAEEASESEASETEAE